VHLFNVEACAFTMENVFRHSIHQMRRFFSNSYICFYATIRNMFSHKVRMEKDMSGARVSAGSGF
jgi:hypothetical protein